MKTRPDKKFLELEKAVAPTLRRQGMHLIQVRYRNGTKDVRPVRNRIRQAPWIPSAPHGFRWQSGKLVPRRAPQAGG
jgi:hypothetical protein